MTFGQRLKRWGCEDHIGRGILGSGRGLGVREMTEARHRKHGGGRAVGAEVGSRSRSFKASLASIRTLDFILSRHELPAGSMQRRGVFWFPFRKDQTVPMSGKLKTVHQSGTEVEKTVAVGGTSANKMATSHFSSAVFLYRAQLFFKKMHPFLSYYIVYRSWLCFSHLLCSSPSLSIEVCQMLEH